MTDAPVGLLFSYGTLRQAEVQRAVFGRVLDSDRDALPGFRVDMVLITDPGVIATSGSERHPILRRTDDPGAQVAGVALAVDAADIAAADAYEVADYARAVVTLRSGRRAYVYLAA